MSAELPETITRRLAALGEFAIMDTPPDQRYDDLAELARQICETPMSTVTLLDAHRQWFKARIGIPQTETSIEHSFCVHAIEHPEEVLVVTDATKDDRFSRSPLVEQSPHIRFYAGAPLVTSTGVAIGAVCVYDTEPRELTPVQCDSLAALSRQTMALVEKAGACRRLRELQARYEELQRSEVYFRHLTEYSLDLVTILAKDGTIRFESRSVERELGYRPEDYLGRNAFEFVHPDDRPAVMKAFDEAIRRLGHTPVIHFRFRHADGSYRVLEGTGNNLCNDPCVQGIVFNSRDITERVRLQQAVERARTEKEETIALLTGGVAHDFNNILTSIQGHAELTAAKLPALSPEARHLADIQAATDRASELTRRLLAFSHRVVLQPRAIAFDPWLRSLQSRLAAVLGPTIALQLTTACDCQVWEDPAQLEQVVLQLAQNAREAMPAGGRVTIEAKPILLGPDRRPDNGRHGETRFVKLSIIDTGSGMDEATLARIFEPYFTTKITGDHSGLGLPMCRGIVEQTGGHLHVASRPGRGTTFQLFLPTTDARQEEPPAPTQPKPGVRTILFVDDEANLRELGRTVLTAAGYRVILAEDGPNALARLAELGSNALDILVTDVLMPGMSGVQLAEEVTRISPTTRILLCSGYTRDALVRSNEIPSGFSFLSKPYKLATLLGRLSELLAEKQAAA